MTNTEGKKPNEEVLGQSDEDIWRSYLGKKDPFEQSATAHPQSKLGLITGISLSGIDLLERKGGQRLSVEDVIGLRLGPDGDTTIKD